VECERGVPRRLLADTRCKTAFEVVGVGVAGEDTVHVCVDAPHTAFESRRVCDNVLDGAVVVEAVVEETFDCARPFWFVAVYRTDDRDRWTVSADDGYLRFGIGSVLVTVTHRSRFVFVVERGYVSLLPS